MKKCVFLIVMLISFTISSQNRSNKIAEKLIGIWTLDAFQQRLKTGDFQVVRSSGTVDPMEFNFQMNDTLVVNYAGKSEKYIWKVNRNQVAIVPISKSFFEDKIRGEYELNFGKNNREVLLQCKGKSQNGIKIRKE